MSEPTISMSYWSTSGQFSSSQIAIEYGSSPVEHGTDQMRIGSPRGFALRRSGQQIGGQACELVLFAIEIGLVDGERVDELLDLAVHVGAQPREVVLEGPRVRRLVIRSTTRRST